jgi:hypothetical protein
MVLRIPRFLTFFLFSSCPQYFRYVVLLTMNVRLIFRTCFTLVENTRYGLYDIDFVYIASVLLHSTICNRVI